jgi:SAM-dependent methyltransferase
MREARKAIIRRFREHHTGVFPWMDLFKGKGCDVGCGPDKLPFDDCIGFDESEGDANFLSRYFPPEAFDYLAASQCLEHLHDPHAVIADWLTLLKPGGVIIVTVPDIGAYENFTYPSKYNSDHKVSFSMIYKGSKFPVHVHIPTFLAQFEDRAEVLLARYVEENFDWNIGHTIDQTYDFMGMTECWNEFVIRRKP